MGNDVANPQVDDIPRTLRAGVYADPKDGRVLTHAEGCTLAEWPRQWPRARFALHPHGFPVFLAPSLLTERDEYAESDPYLVEAHIEDDFQVRRVEVTLDLLRHALAGAQREEPARILDVACGEGHITERIRAEISGAALCGIDHSVSAIVKAARRYPSIEFAVSDAYELPYPAGAFNAVVLNNIYEHVPDPVRLMVAVRRVLRPGGFIVISTPSRYRFGNLVRVLRGRPISFMSSHHVTEYTVGQVIEQLRYAGYEVTRIAGPAAQGIKGGPARWLTEHVAKPALRLALRAIGSWHSIEGTVFFLARDTRRD